MNKNLEEYFSGRRFHSISDYLKKEFGEKTIKLSIDGGFTCPNRDGSKGINGCTFCSDSGSGEFSSNIEDQIKLLSVKWPKAKYIAYFQNHTNTYAPVEILKERYSAVLKNEKISGIAIATRPDCITDEALDLLDEINRNNFMWVELGLQTIHEKTAEEINRCYDLNCFMDTYNKLIERNIKVVVHLILGLPGETESDMLESVRYVSHLKNLFGIKLHLLNVMKGSTLSVTHPDYVSFNSIEEYVDLVVRCVEIIPKEVTIHRLTADAKRNLLISPVWSFNKRTILNSINDRLNLLDTWQGKKA
ncbi:MAG: TIGR01212 family radical SAM protein [Clostridia bacterium]|nr:TIGR01212 family radical SAM protein [Clostridia bacterium]